MVFQGPFISEDQVTEDPSALYCAEQEDLENLFRRALHVVKQTGKELFTNKWDNEFVV